MANLHVFSDHVLQDRGGAFFAPDVVKNCSFFNPLSPPLLGEMLSKLLAAAVSLASRWGLAARPGRRVWLPMAAAVFLAPRWAPAAARKGARMDSVHNCPCSCAQAMDNCQPAMHNAARCTQPPGSYPQPAHSRISGQLHTDSTMPAADENPGPSFLPRCARVNGG